MLSKPLRGGGGAGAPIARLERRGGEKGCVQKGNREKYLFVDRCLNAADSYM